MGAQQKPVFNSSDCPLLLRTNIIRLVPAACLNHAVSVVHQCDKYEHNWKNNNYCFNVYCMSNAL